MNKQSKKKEALQQKPKPKKNIEKLALALKQNLNRRKEKQTSE